MKKTLRDRPRVFKPNRTTRRAVPSRAGRAKDAGRIVLGVSDKGLRLSRRWHQGVGLRVKHHRATVNTGTLVFMRLARRGTEVVRSVLQAAAPNLDHGDSVKIK
jgi:hypothetical protein